MIRLAYCCLASSVGDLCDKQLGGSFEEGSTRDRARSRARTHHHRLRHGEVGRPGGGPGRDRHGRGDAARPGGDAARRDADGRGAGRELRAEERSPGGRGHLAYQAFSRKGLIEQLKYEGYSKAEAEYAVDAINVNWKEQAVKSAKDYLDYQSFSRSGLIEQLEYEGFTHAQAVYGVQKAY
jgi:Host cell surface-exposed lipoprotein